MNDHVEIKSQRDITIEQLQAQLHQMKADIAELREAKRGAGNTTIIAKSPPDIDIAQVQSLMAQVMEQLDSLRGKQEPLELYKILAAKERELDKLRAEVKRLNEVIDVTLKDKFQQITAEAEMWKSSYEAVESMVNEWRNRAMIG